jgi:hypothetical protein
LSSTSNNGPSSLARTRPGGNDQAVSSRPDGQGRIAFDFRIGITGHRCLGDQQELVEAVRDALQLITGLLPEHAGSDVALVAVSSLAEGADRLVSHVLLAEPGSRLEVILPAARLDYERDFRDSESTREFRHLLQQASQVRKAPGLKSREEAYEWAGRQVVDRCDALIAVWDGRPSRGRGGTAEIVQYARDCGVPLAWVHTDGELQVTTELHLKSERVQALQAAMHDLNEYNKSEITLARFEAGTQSQRSDLGLDAALTAPDDALERAREDAADWLVPFLVRADLLAVLLRRRFRILSTAIFAMAAASVAVVAVQINFFPRQDWLVSFEVLLLLALLAVPLIRRRIRLHERWTSYRFLAERLRSAYFLSLAGTGDRSHQPGQSASFSDPTVAWIERALSQITASRPRMPLVASGVGSLRSYLNCYWIGGQIRYFSRTSEYNDTRENLLRNGTAVLFGTTLICAVLHASGLGPRLHLAAELVLLSLSVPAAGAALHGIGTQREFGRHAQRCERMVTQLEKLQDQMGKTQSLSQLRQVAVSVESSLREESNDWFGVMRFHNVELIM